MKKLFTEIQFITERPETVTEVFGTIVQREFNHDIATFMVRNDRASAQRYDTGTPVRFRWGVAPNGINNFIGYVHHTEPLYNPAGQTWQRNAVKVVCIAASFRLKEPRQQTWLKRTIPSVIQEILTEHRLSAYVQDDTRVWESITADGKSTWAFLQTLARDKLGWTLYAPMTDVIVRDRLASLEDMKEKAVIFDAIPQGDYVGTEHDLFNFKAVDGESTPDGGRKANRIKSAIDPRFLTRLVANNDTADFRTTLLGERTNDPFFTLFEQQPVSSMDEMNAVLDGTTQANRFHIQARAEVLGNSGVRQGMLVAFQGLGRKNDGFWYTHGVEHVIGRNGYRLHLELGRDSSWDTGERPNVNRRARRVVKPRISVNGLRAETPPAVLVNSTWRSQYNIDSAVPVA